MPERRRNQHLARQATTLALGLAKLWGRSPGSVGIGLALVEIYWTANQWATVGHIHQRIGHQSPDTLRRRLEPMVEAGLVEFTEADQRRLYRATEKAALQTISLIEDAMVHQPKDGLVGVARMS